MIAEKKKEVVVGCYYHKMNANEHKRTDKDIDKDIELLKEMQWNCIRAVDGQGKYLDEKALQKAQAIENILNFIDMTKDFETHTPKDIELVKQFNKENRYRDGGKLNNAIDELIDYVERTEHTRKLACGFHKMYKKKSSELETIRNENNQLKLKLKIADIYRSRGEYEKAKSIMTNELRDIENTNKELETYKKIAEVLALRIIELNDEPFRYCKVKEDGECDDLVCHECIIAWARKNIEGVVK